VATAPILIWDFREGTGTTVNDRSAGTAANITLTPGASGVWDTSGGSNKTGYNFAGTASGITGLLTSTKVQTALSATKVVTLEFVIDSAASTSTYDEYFKLQDGSGNGIFGITVNHAQGGLLMSASEGSSPNDCSVKYAIATSGIIVGHFTVNSATATAIDRPKLYIAGSRVTPTVVDQIGLNVALDQGVNWSTVKAYLGEAGALIGGKIRYLAIYAYEMNATDVAANATALASNDDADPNSTGVSVALTGLSATVSRGTPVPSVSRALSGQSATSSFGSLSFPGSSSALTGQSATASGGTLTPAIGVPLTGRALTSARGTIVPAVALPLTGQSVASGLGTLFVAAPSVAPVWQALITEGTGTAIGDTAAGTAVNLTLGGSTGWTSNTGGVGYNYGNNASLAAANTSLSGTKLQTAFAGATKCSIEFEANLASFITGNVILYLGNNAVTGTVFLISCDGAGGIIITSADGAYEFTATTGLHVYLIEIDSTLAAGSRIKAKVDGTVKTMIVNTEMTSGVALDVNCSTWSSNRLTMGGTNGSDSLNGSVFYAAIYAITGVVDHTAALIANNDAAPNNNITVALTGIAVAVSRGLLAAATAVGLIGQSSTSSQGSISQGTGQALTGQQLTTSGGVLGVNVSRSMTGIGASASQGTQSAAIATPLTGQSATSAKGFLAPPNTVFAALTGLFATTSAGTLRPSIGVSLTGRSVVTSIGTTVGAIARSLTGVAISAIGGLFTPVTPVSQRKFLATSLVSADVSLSLVPSDQSRTLVEG
jgi:hypothetical protein